MGGGTPPTAALCSIFTHFITTLSSTDSIAIAGIGRALQLFTDDKLQVYYSRLPYSSLVLLVHVPESLIRLSRTLTPSQLHRFAVLGLRTVA